MDISSIFTEVSLECSECGEIITKEIPTRYVDSEETQGIPFTIFCKKCGSWRQANVIAISDRGRQ